MIISKCVPLEISRKRFSDFTKNNTPQNVKFVGWRYGEDGKKENVQLDYQSIRAAIVKYIEEHGGWSPEGGTVPNIPATPVDVNEVFFFTLTYIGDDEDNKQKYPEPEQGDQPSWNDEAGSHIVDLKKEQGALEINGGGNYTEQTVFLVNPAIGSITNIVIDNTGRNKRENETEEEWEQHRVPVKDFTFYYGVLNNNNREKIITVPPWCRGVVQILHGTNTDMIINTTFTEITINEYISDVMPIDSQDQTGETHIYQPVDQPNMNIDMNNEKAYVEFVPDEHLEYTFWFSQPELGSSTYIVINNTDNVNDVLIKYGKNTGYQKYIQQISDVLGGEKCVIEIFHSLSADIIVKVTKVDTVGTVITE